MRQYIAAHAGNELNLPDKVTMSIAATTIKQSKYLCFLDTWGHGLL